MRRTASQTLLPLFAALAVAAAWLLRDAVVGLEPARAILLGPASSLRLPFAVSRWWDVPCAAAWTWCFLRVRDAGGPEGRRAALFDGLLAAALGAIAATVAGLAWTGLAAVALGAFGGAISFVVQALVRRSAPFFRTRVPPPAFRALARAALENGVWFGLLIALGAGAVSGLPVGALFGLAACAGICAGMTASFAALKALSAAPR